MAMLGSKNITNTTAIIARLLRLMRQQRLEVATQNAKIRQPDDEIL